MPIAYPYSCAGTTFYFQLSVFANDGSVAISHGGTEMGQVRVQLLILGRAPGIKWIEHSALETEFRGSNPSLGEVVFLLAFIFC